MVSILTTTAITGDPAGISGRLRTRLLAGDDTGSWALVEHALAQGVPLADLYVDVLARALSSVGEGWERGEVDVAAEHVASATAGRLLHRMADLPAPSPGPGAGTVLTATPPGERHGLPVFILAEVLRLAGFRVVNLGPDVPLDSLLAAIQRTPGLVGVCLTATVVAPEVLDEAVAVARSGLPDSVPVLVGGRSAREPSAADARDVPVLLGQSEGWRSFVPARAGERATDETVRRLQHVTDAALAYLDLDELLDEVTARTVEALDADTMAVFLLDGAELVSRATRCPEGPLREEVRVPIGGGVAGRIAEHRGPMVVDDLAELDPDSPLVLDNGVRSLTGVPLAVAGELIGVLHVGSRRVGHFTEDDAQFVQLVADRVAQAIDRARLFQAEREARTLAEAAQRRLGFLTDAGEALSRSLDWQTTLDTVVQQAVPFLADWCAIDFVDDEDAEPRCVAVAHREPNLESVVRQLHDSRPPDRESARGVGAVVRTGQPRIWQVVEPEAMTAVAGSEERLALFRTLGPTSAIVLPLHLRGRLVGAISFVHSVSGRRYTEADIDLAQELVRRAAVALDNARLFAERSEVARTLQDSLLPPHLPEIPGAEVAGLFRAGGEGVDVGGDFYDVFATGPGDWALVVGDVCGKGAAAAGVTAQGRYTIRAAAMQARKPSRVLHVLNEAMLRQEASRPFLTVAYARLQLGDGAGPPGARVTVGCGGHPLPLILRADGSVETVGVPGTLLGCFPDVVIEDVTADLHSGDSLVLYTDGVEEPRNAAGESFGVEGLQAVLSASAGLSPEQVNVRVYEAVVAHRGDRASDDIAVVTLRLA